MTQSKPNVHSIFSALDKRLHRSKRRIISAGLSEKSIRRFEPIMTSQIDIFIDSLRERAQPSHLVNMTIQCKYLALDISSQFGFGSSLELQTSAQNRFIAEGMEAGMYRTYIHMQFPMSKYLGVDAFLLPFLFSIKERYKAALKGLIAKRLAIGENAREDLFSFVVGLRDPETGKEMSQSDLFAEAEFFLPAGAYTLVLSYRSTRCINDQNRRANNFFCYLRALFLPCPVPRLLQASCGRNSLNLHIR